MKKLINILVLFAFLLISACSTFTLTKQSLIEQLNQNQQIGSDPNFQVLSLVDYPSNNLMRIKCVDDKGKLVWLYPDKNTEFIITKKSDGDRITTYFDTLILQNDTLFGLRSRLIGGLRKIPVDDIDKVEVYAEFPDTEPVKENK
jgi:hypothetical protein